jgi:hypothetical protein
VRPRSPAREVLNLLAPRLTDALLWRFDRAHPDSRGDGQPAWEFGPMRQNGMPAGSCRAPRRP